MKTQAEDGKPRVVITFGTFDLFHMGHLRLLARAKAEGDHLIVGVSTDQLTHEKKGRSAVHRQSERLAIISSLRCVDQTFLEHSLDEKRQYITRYGADVLVMGDDWRDQFDTLSDVCEVVYLPRTPTLSTTAIIEKIRSEAS